MAQDRSHGVAWAGSASPDDETAAVPHAQDEGFLDLLYGAAVEPGLWPRAMETFADLLGGSGAWLSRLSVADGSGEGVLARIDPHMATLYAEHYAGINPFSNAPDPGAFMAAWTPTILTDEAWMPKADLARREYYNDFMRPQDIHSFMIVRLAAHGFDVSSLTINRPRGREPFGHAELAQAQRLHGHLRRAFRMTERLASSGLADDDLENAGAGAAVFVLDGDGRLQRMTPAAEALLADRDDLSVAGGRLATPGDPSGRLEGLIAAAAARAPAARRDASLVRAGAEGRPPRSIDVARARSERLAVFRQRPAVIVTCAESVADDDPRLTSRERDALTWVAEGKSDWEIGVILGLSETTVRFHVDNARRKLGAVNRVHAVAKLLAAGSPRR
ncbi:helix-turn-helix transcriptional regulator [Phenylobacterium sp.]|uniref:helix-turn-helix transcriptional regulator n=1 Tax=Phenylobacterium sp. TaxID=1871053 RepID=UPI00301C831B